MGSWSPPRPHRSRLGWAQALRVRGATGCDRDTQGQGGVGVHRRGLGLGVQLWKPLAGQAGESRSSGWTRFMAWQEAVRALLSQKISMG